MKLIECYIENFGKISQQKFTFEDGFNCICQNNGEGKTTLTVFIKVMLFGMTDTKKQSVAENERKHYLPWQGGKCGGYLVVETDEGTYRIERSFAPKAADDTYRRVDVATGAECTDTAESFGIQVFGIDADAFERTVFHSERALSSKNDNSLIAAKLSDLSGTDGDMGGVDDALRLLEEQRKFYQKRGGSGKLTDISTKISETELKLASLARTEAELSEIEEKIKNISSEIATLDDDSRRLMKDRGESLLLRSQAGNVERYNKTQTRVDDLVKRKSELIEFFAGQIPTFENLEKASLYHSRAEQIYKDIKERSADTKEYKQLALIFGTTLSDESITAVREACAREKNREYNLTALRASRFGEVFDKRIPTDDEISAMQNSLTETSAAKPILPIILALASVAAFVLGAIVSPIIFAPAAALLVLAIAIFSTSASKAKKQRLERDEKIASFFASVCPKISAEDSAALLREMRELRKKAPDENEGAEDQEIIDSFNRTYFGVGDNRISAAEEVMKRFEYFERLKIEKAVLEESLKKERSEADRLTVVSRAFTLKYKTTEEDPFNEIRRKLTEYNELTSLIVAGHAELAGLGAPSIESSSDRKLASVEEIDAQIRTVDARRVELERTRGALLKYKEELEYSLLEKDTLAATLAELHEEYTDATERLNVILLTQKYLGDARNIMTAKYLGKTRAALIAYLSEFSDEYEEFEIDTSFEVKKIERGETRTLDSYSKGTRELYNLAAKMALCDSLYESELPFLVFDDPFSAFDDERVAKGLELLHRISEKRQVIYLTCSTSRATKA